jgi:glycosyltransferase involved in cell wall biosynthesis
VLEPGSDTESGVIANVTTASSGKPRTRLLFLSAMPPPTGGIPTWLLAVLSSELSDRFEMRVVDTSPPEKQYVESGSRFRLDRAFGAVPALGRLVWQLIWFRPALLHINTPYFWAMLRDGAAVWLGSLFGAKTLLHFHGGDLKESIDLAPATVRWLIEVTMQRADRVVPITRQTERYLEGKVAAPRIAHLPNFLDLEDFDGLMARSGTRRGTRLQVLFVGWLLEAKGVPELLEAAAHYPDVDFTLIGHHHSEFVERIADQLEAARDHVRVLEPRPREEMIGLYAEADVFVLPTLREGFPMVVLEAMAARLPVVATPIGAIPDVVRDGQEGIIVPPANAEALAAALGRLLDDPALRRRMGERGRRRVEDVYSRDVVMAQLETIYRGLLDD